MSTWLTTCSARARRRGRAHAFRVSRDDRAPRRAARRRAASRACTTASCTSWCGCPSPSVGELLRTLGVSKQALNGPLRDLYAQKLITYSRSADDARVKHLSLTTEGPQARRPLVRIAARAVRRGVRRRRPRGGSRVEVHCAGSLPASSRRRALRSANRRSLDRRIRRFPVVAHHAVLEVAGAAREAASLAELLPGRDPLGAQRRRRRIRGARAAADREGDRDTPAELEVRLVSSPWPSENVRPQRAHRGAPRGVGCGIDPRCARAGEPDLVLQPAVIAIRIGDFAGERSPARARARPRCRAARCCRGCA